MTQRNYKTAEYVVNSSTDFAVALPGGTVQNSIRLHASNTQYIYIGNVEDANKTNSFLLLSSQDMELEGVVGDICVTAASGTGSLYMIYS